MANQGVVAAHGFPTPTPDADSTPYWQALREHRVLFQRCAACGHSQLYFRALCRSCWSRDLHEVQAGGTGTVHSLTVCHSVGNPALAAELPYALALVDLDEGPRVMTRIVGEPSSVRIGDRVTATFRDLDEECSLLYFERQESGVASSVQSDLETAARVPVGVVTAKAAT
jgi:uncharacterized OB-fold protein